MLKVSAFLKSHIANVNIQLIYTLVETYILKEKELK